MLECPDCEKAFRGARCPTCGWAPPAPPPLREAKPAYCALDGTTLERGFCHAGGGYPVTSACPFACPLCGQRLGWDGGCEACHGCTTGRREDWTFPGHRFELDAGHYVRDDSLPPGRRACTPAQNAAGLAAVQLILATANLPAAPAPPRLRLLQRAGLAQDAS